MTDIIVIGGGPAGISAALTALHRGKTAAIVSTSPEDSPLWKAEKINNYPGLPEMTGADMLRAMLAGHEVQIDGVFYSLSPQGDNICTREPANSCLDPDVNYILDTPFNTIARKATRMTDGERHRLETLLGLPVSPVPSLVPGDDEEAPVP